MLLQLAWLAAAGIAHSSLEIASGPPWALLLAVATRRPLGVLAASRTWCSMYGGNAPSFTAQCALLAAVTGNHLPRRSCQCVSAAVAWSLTTDRD